MLPFPILLRTRLDDIPCQNIVIFRAAFLAHSGGVVLPIMSRPLMGYSVDGPDIISAMRQSSDILWCIPISTTPSG
jgi:hypothetical protein